MANYKNMRLCGGTFLVLLFEAKRKGRRTQYRQGRPSEAMSNPDLFGHLVRAVNPDFKMPSGRSFGTFTTEYKMCRDTDTPYVGLTDDHYVRQFNESIENSYYKILLSFFTSLESAILWETKGPWLVAALLDLIDADDTIPADAEFHVHPYGETVTKAELRNIECICIPAFVFGVWHYIITKVQDNNVGASTLQLLLDNSAENHGERKFISDIGKETLKTIKTSVDTPKFELKNHKIDLTDEQKKIPSAMAQHGSDADVHNVQKFKSLYKSRSFGMSEQMLLNDSEAVVHLNDVLETFSLNNISKAVYVYQTTCRFESAFAPDRSRQVKVRFNINGTDFCGFTTTENWESKSVMNNTLFAGTLNCTIWFYIVSADSSQPVVQFLMIGDSYE